MTARGIAPPDELTNALIEEAESVFGKRVEGYTFVGTQISNRNGIRFLDDRTVLIDLEPNTASNPNLRRFQLSHEVVHLLGPVRQATVFEEGAATWFSVNNSHLQSGEAEHARNWMSSHAARYFNALLLYDEFVTRGGSVKTLRSQKPFISNITTADFDLLPDIPEPLVTKLLDVFERPPNPCSPPTVTNSSQ